MAIEQNQESEDCCGICRFWEDLHRGNGYGECEIKSIGCYIQLTHKTGNCERFFKK